MKRTLLALLGLVLVLGLFAAVGYAGYRYGYIQGAQTTANGNAPQLRPFDNDDSRGMPMRPFGFDRGFDRRFGFGGFPMMGFGFFSPLRWLASILVLALIAWFIYWLFTRSGWRLTRTAPIAEPQPTSTETESTE